LDQLRTATPTPTVGAGRSQNGGEKMLWILLVGAVAGFLARLVVPGPNTVTGFILTIVLGVAGAFLATFVGQTIGWYRADQGAGFIAATIGAIAVLFIWNRLVASGRIGDPGVGPSA
jgi:uncharacterized membrane protein YeaQ/YmgE (transglycosylase-associated protein family)